MHCTHKRAHSRLIAFILHRGMSWKTYKRLSTPRSQKKKLLQLQVTEFTLVLQTSNVMKLLLVVTVLLVTFEFAPPALATPMLEEEALAMLQAIRTIVDAEENFVHENQAVTASTTTTPTAPGTRRPPQMVPCFKLKQGYPCFDCTEWGGKHITLCFKHSWDTTFVARARLLLQQ